MDKQDKLKNKLQQMQAQMIMLNEQVNVGGENQGGLYADLEEFSTLLEELSVAEEELRVQNEELENTRLAVEKERSRYLELFEFAPDGYLLSDKFGIILEVNQAMSLMLNTPAERLGGKPLALFIYSEDKKEFRNKLNNIGAVETIENWDLRLQPKKKEMIHSRVKITVKHKPTEKTFELFWMFHNVSDLVEITEMLRVSEANLKLLSNDLVSRIEDEKMKLSMDLHDHIGQALTCLKLSIRPNILMNKDYQEQKEILEIASQQIGEILDSVADLSLRLRPQLLDDLGLAKAISWRIKQVMKQTGSMIKENITLEIAKRFDTPVEITLYRIFEEALNNAVKHANANVITITLAEGDNAIKLTIADNGIGIDPSELEKESQHSGFTGMKERINMIGGTLQTTSKLGIGTTIQATAPII